MEHVKRTQHVKYENKNFVIKQHNNEAQRKLC